MLHTLAVAAPNGMHYVAYACVGKAGCAAVFPKRAVIATHKMLLLIATGGTN